MNFRQPIQKETLEFLSTSENEEGLLALLNSTNFSGTQIDGIPLDLGRTNKTTNLTALVKAISKELRSTKAAKTTQKKGLTLSLNLVLSNLAFTLLTSGDNVPIRYSRRTGDYRKGRYNLLGVGFRSLIAVVDGLGELGYLKLIPGHWDATEGENRQSRMLPTPNLTTLLAKAQISFEDVKDALPKETILLKNPDKRLMEYDDTDETNRMRIHLRTYNDFLSKTEITLPLEYVDGVNFLSKSHYRVFNEESFDRNGRFYGTWWQGISASVREHILINGNETVRLDYSAMNFHLAYSKAGLDYWDKTKEPPYALDEFPDLFLPLIKICGVVAFNASRWMSAIYAVEKDARKQAKKLEQRGEPTEGLNTSVVDVGKMLNALKKKHSPIADRFYSGTGLELNNLESQITESIISKFIGKGIPILNIHDEFIVEEQYGSSLNLAMYEAFEAKGLKSIPRIK
jgi:hypothetical protein